ncbi:ABC transporter ATP-binding protein [Cribrihabitans sp. XS_ASV171]
MIELEKTVKRFGTFTALHGIDATVREGEFFSLLGPSGCGKTTLLRLIAGFENPTSGTIRIAGRDMQSIPANERPTNMVFQSYAIFPHLNVAQNVGYGLKRRRLSKNDMAREVGQALEMVDMAGYERRAAHELSGGQRQRVALARALVMRPKVVLLDEPLSALDKKLREQMQRELRDLQRSIGITFVLVTHDQEEALIMSDRIAVMFEGRIAQMASPEELYRRPASRRVASFIGVMNFLPARATGETQAGLSLKIEALGEVDLPPDAIPHGLRADDIREVGIRPEMLTVIFDDTFEQQHSFEGQVTGNSYYGDMTYYDVVLPGSERTVTISMRNTANRAVVRPGNAVRVGWSAESIVLFRQED